MRGARTFRAARGLRAGRAGAPAVDRGSVADMGGSVTAERRSVADLGGSVTVDRGSVADLGGSVTAERRSVADVRGSVTAERGSVTAELAVGLVGVVMLLGLVLLLTAAATAQLRCTEAARAAARAAALGEEDAEVVEVARRSAGDAARVDVVRAAGWVTVTVGCAVAGDVGGLDARATSTTPVEP